MALTIKQLFEPTVLTTGAATLYTCPASPPTSVLPNGRVRFTNTTGGAVTITAYAVPSAGTAGAGNCFAFQEAIGPNAHADYDVPMLAAGDFLQALASAGTSITATALQGVVYNAP